MKGRNIGGAPAAVALTSPFVTVHTKERNCRLCNTLHLATGKSLSAVVSEQEIRPFAMVHMNPETSIFGQPTAMPTRFLFVTVFTAYTGIFS